MKYISYNQDSGWDLRRYFQYLQQNQSGFPPNVYDFAINWKHYDLLDHQSLHDAWLEQLSIIERATGSRSEIRAIDISCRLLGPFHDLFINLKYIGVHEYSLSNPSGYSSKPDRFVGHGDILMHEVTMSDAGLACHELLFSRGSIFRITFDGIKHEIEHREPR